MAYKNYDTGTTKQNNVDLPLSVKIAEWIGGAVRSPFEQDQEFIRIKPPTNFDPYQIINSTSDDKKDPVNFLGDLFDRDQDQDQDQDQLMKVSFIMILLIGIITLFKK